MKCVIPYLLMLSISTSGCALNRACKGHETGRFVILPAPPTSLRLDTSTGKTHLFLHGTWVPMKEVSQEEWDNVQQRGYNPSIR